ncbi:MAG TPA: hypothetical protein VJL89_14105 [Thermodesulfovibrionia bacterium]|nr:hypothetical protein [Thermodesulfovibrionia bacterium]
MAEQSDTKKTIPEFLYPLFWEYNPKEMDIIQHSDTIMGRIMEHGTWQAMCWLRVTYKAEQIVSFLERRGKRVLPLRELNYWALVSGVSEEKRKKWLKEAKEQLHVWRKRASL